MWKEFKEFAMKGNIMDLAIGVIIGGAFQKIVNSLVNDIIMPFLAIFIGNIDYSELVLTINNVSIKYGSFITNVINFLIMAFAIFLFVRYINKLNRKLEKMKIEEFNRLNAVNEKLLGNNKFFKKKKKQKKEEPIPEPTTKLCPYCLTEINIKATRCPNCTSKLEEAVEKSSEVLEEQLEIEEQ